MTDNVVPLPLKPIRPGACRHRPRALVVNLNGWGEAIGTLLFGRGDTAASVIARGRNGAVVWALLGRFCVIRDTA